jgi:hypothetical protein
MYSATDPAHAQTIDTAPAARLPHLTRRSDPWLSNHANPQPTSLTQTCCYHQVEDGRQGLLSAAESVQSRNRRADAGTRNEINRNSGQLECVEYADVRVTLGPATAKSQSNLLTEQITRHPRQLAASGRFWWQGAAEQRVFIVRGERWHANHSLAIGREVVVVRPRAALITRTITPARETAESNCACVWRQRHRARQLHENVIVGPTQIMK